MADDRSAHSLNFGEERIEVVALGAGAFSQTCLHQAPQAKPVVYPHHTAAVWALVVFVRGR